MNLKIVGILLFFLILISIQFTLNQILQEVRRINRRLERLEEKEWLDEKRENIV